MLVLQLLLLLILLLLLLHPVGDALGGHGGAHCAVGRARRSVGCARFPSRCPSSLHMLAPHGCVKVKSLQLRPSSSCARAWLMKLLGRIGAQVQGARDGVLRIPSLPPVRWLAKVYHHRTSLPSQHYGRPTSPSPLAPPAFNTPAPPRRPLAAPPLTKLTRSARAAQGPIFPRGARPPLPAALCLPPCCGCPSVGSTCPVVSLSPFITAPLRHLRVALILLFMCHDFGSKNEQDEEGALSPSTGGVSSL